MIKPAVMYRYLFIVLCLTVGRGDNGSTQDAIVFSSIGVESSPLDTCVDVSSSGLKNQSLCYLPPTSFDKPATSYFTEKVDYPSLLSCVILIWKISFVVGMVKLSLCIRSILARVDTLEDKLLHLCTQMWEWDNHSANTTFSLESIQTTLDYYLYNHHSPLRFIPHRRPNQQFQIPSKRKSLNTRS